MLSTLREVGIIPVIRADSADAAKAVVDALVEAGLNVAEITMTVPRAIDAIASVGEAFRRQDARRRGDCYRCRDD